MTDATTIADIRKERRQQEINDVRAMIDWLEANPEIPLPDSFSSFPRSTFDTDEFLRIAKLMGSFAKEVSGDDASAHFRICKRFGRAEYSLWTLRKNVCTARQIGTRTLPAQPEREEPVYEWECPDSLLSDAPAE